MSGTAVKVFGSIAGWSFLPDFATRTLVTSWARLSKRPLTPQHYRVTYVCVVLAYLIYNFVDATTSVPPSYYELLHVTPAADSNTLKLAFRAFARKNHPDRVGIAGTTLFVAVREGYEALTEPNKRWAYDRFGPDILKCTECITQGDFLHRGLLTSLGFHITSGVALLSFSAFGTRNWVTFWRYMLYIVLVAAEIFFIFHPSPGTRTPYDSPQNLLETLHPHRVPFQHIRFIHHAFVFLSVALGRVVPVLLPTLAAADTTPENALNLLASSDILARARRLDRQAYQLLSGELAAIAPEDDTKREDTMLTLTRGMERLVLETRLTAGAGAQSSTGPQRPPQSAPASIRGGLPVKRPIRRRHLSAASSEASFSTVHTPSMNTIPDVIDVDAEEANVLFENGVAVDEELKRVGAKDGEGNGRAGAHDWLHLPENVHEQNKSPAQHAKLVRRQSMPGEYFRGRSMSY